MFRWLGEPLAIDLANTVMVVRDGEAVDLLADRRQLRRWLQAERARLGPCGFALDHLDEVRDLRDAVRAVLTSAAGGAAPPEGAVARLNAASAAAPVAPQLGGRLERVERPAAGDALANLLGAVARSAIHLATESGGSPLRICRAPSCGMFFQGSRRWCCAACGNRARAARHYRRSRDRR